MKFGVLVLGLLLSVSGGQTTVHPCDQPPPAPLTVTVGQLFGAGFCSADTFTQYLVAIDDTPQFPFPGPLAKSLTANSKLAWFYTVPAALKVDVEGPHTLTIQIANVLPDGTNPAGFSGPSIAVAFTAVAKAPDVKPLPAPTGVRIIKP